MRYMELFFRGFGTNVLITICAALVPICLGVLLSLLAKRSTLISTIISAINIPFESIVIPVAVVACYYVVGRFFHLNYSGLIPSIMVVFVLSLAYLFYIPTRYNKNDSFVKNTLYNGLGLLSNLFKWSFVAHLVGVAEALRASNYIMNHQFRPWPYLVTFAVAFVILLLVEAARFLVKTFLK